MGLVVLLCGMLSLGCAVAGGMWLSANPQPDARADARLVLYAAMVFGIIAIALFVYSV